MGIADIAQSVFSSEGSRKARRQEVAGLESGIQELQGGMQIARDLADPYVQMGVNNLGTLQSAVSGTDNYQDPLLAQIQDQVTQRLMQNAAVSGRMGAGEMPALMAAGLIDPAIQLRQQRINNLFGLTDRGQQASMTLGQNELTNATNIANLRSGVGGAKARGTLGQYAGYQNTVQGIQDAAMQFAKGGFGGF